MKSKKVSKKSKGRTRSAKSKVVIKVKKKPDPAHWVKVLYPNGKDLFETCSMYVQASLARLQGEHEYAEYLTAEILRRAKNGWVDV